MKHQLPATYEQFVERVFAKDRSRTRDLSFANGIARQFTGVGECAFGAAGECGCCARPVLNAEPFATGVTAHYHLSQKQHDDLHVRLMEDGELNATEDGICRNCRVLQGTSSLPGR